MRQKTVVWVLIGAAAVVALLGAYAYRQYRGATPPALDTLPIYSRAAQVPLSEVAEPGLADAERTLRAFAAGALDQRFLATDGPLTWDAVRHNIGSFLGEHGYRLDDDTTSPDGTVESLRYRHGNPVRRRFNDDVIMVVALTNPVGRTSSGRDIRVYAYFLLGPGG